MEGSEIRFLLLSRGKKDCLIDLNVLFKVLLFCFIVCIFQNFLKTGALLNIWRVSTQLFSIGCLMPVRTHCLFCSVPFTIFLFICCSPKTAVLHCSIYFLSGKCQCIYVMKVPICMCISGISIEMMKAVHCWSIIVFDLVFFPLASLNHPVLWYLLPPTEILALTK